ncbi:TRAP transporter small permease [Notoacmeibacter sp. MSK16QG-6]|uniref:TRAP transporter small permease n=1 Tax=Notoacmeibacter sp. MSK16QG-6 TaxID=2957982 RepID=UPI00209D337D|nr:TRAP transporter small permease subunit [Notoacmeibacter sp. MSK16QG-6]MCP1199576.1 TRAP transporter small permease subunit [Notoacmeibacter sp. MSK16QG-6]
MRAFSMISALKLWARLELIVASTLLTLIVVLIGYQIVARSLFGAPLVWAEEAAMFCFLWVTFIGAGLAAKLGQHIRVSALEAFGGERLALALDIFGAIVAGATLFYIGKLAFGFLPIEMRTTSIALPIDIPKAYFFSIPLVYASISMTAGLAGAAWIGRTHEGKEQLQSLRHQIFDADHSEGVL